MVIDVDSAQLPKRVEWREVEPLPAPLPPAAAHIQAPSYIAGRTMLVS